MSANMYWEPQRREGKGLSFDFRRAVSPTWFNHDGSLGSGRIVIDGLEEAFLRGLMAAGSDEVKADARTLLEAIERYGAVEVWIER